MKNIINGKIIKIKEYEFFVPKFIENDNIFSIILLKDEKKITPAICFTETISEEDYDYDYEENLVFTGINSSQYLYPIKYNPYTGQQFEFKSTETLDLTSKCEELDEKFKIVNAKRKSSKKSSELFLIRKELNELLKEIPPIFNKADLLDEDDEIETYYESDGINAAYLITENIYWYIFKSMLQWIYKVNLYLSNQV